MSSLTASLASLLIKNVDKMEDQIESKMTDKDWEDIKNSEFVDIAEGVSSFAVIFRDEQGLHGFQVKYSSEKATLEPKSFNKEDSSFSKQNAQTEDKA